MAMRTVTGLVLAAWFLGCGGSTSGSEAPGGGEPPGTDDDTPRARPCTLIGCTDHATITAQMTGEQARAGEHRFTIVADGTSVRCQLTHTNVGEVAHAQCDGGVSLSFGPRMEWVETQSPVEGTVMATSRAVPGAFEWTASLVGRPASVQVIHELDGVVLRDQTEAPAYTPTRPNGAGCDPECQVALIRWSAS